MDYYDRYRRGGGRADYPADDDVRERERPYYVRRRRRFDKYRVTGLLLVFFGVSILTLGIFDLGWTVSRYGNNCQDEPSGMFRNCEGNHVWVYVGSPLWGGSLLICAAFVALGIHPDKANHRRAHRHFLLLLAVNFLLTMPATIILNALEVYFGGGVFWIIGDGQMETYDSLQFGLPIAIIALVFIAWIVILFFGVFIYCCSEDYRVYRSKKYVERDDAPEDNYRGRQWSHDPYRNYYRGQGYGGGNGGGRRYFYN